MIRKTQKFRRFLFAELIVIIAIIFVLVTFAMPWFKDAVESSKVMMAFKLLE